MRKLILTLTIALAINANADTVEIYKPVVPHLPPEATGWICVTKNIYGNVMPPAAARYQIEITSTETECRVVRSEQ